MTLDDETREALGYGDPWGLADHYASNAVIEWRERMRAERAAFRARGDVHPSDAVDERRREQRRAAAKARYVPHPRPVLTDEERREHNREKVRARRAAMTVEARRAEWLRAQHARRARLREMRTAAVAA